jgi:hypothetical protein
MFRRYSYCKVATPLPSLPKRKTAAVTISFMEDTLATSSSLAIPRGLLGRKEAPRNDLGRCGPTERRIR